MADQTKVSGTISFIGPEEQITEKMRKQLLVVNTGGQYPEDIAVEFINDKIDLIHGYATGEQVDVFVNIRGRKWNERYFVSLAGWKVERTGALTGQQNIAAGAGKATGGVQKNAPIASDEDNILPF